MRRRLAPFAALAALAVSAAAAAAGLATRVVPPLAAPGVEPGISRCTSDGACVVTEADGTTRAGTPFEIVER